MWRFGQLIDALDTKFMITNTDKTFYLHLCDEPFKVDTQLSNGITIQSAENNKHLYLGMWFKKTASITEQMIFNLNHRAYIIAKHYDWLDVNLMTLNNSYQTTCAQLLHVLNVPLWLWMLVNHWWSQRKHSCLGTKVLKSILQVKISTPNALIYIELTG